MGRCTRDNDGPVSAGALLIQVIDEDRAVNRKRFEIEEQAIRLIATQQPMASDLRAIVAVLNIIVDLERIGDYAVGNARIALRHRDRELLTFMLNDPQTIDRATWLMWVAHNLERCADRVTNICERIVYEATGRMEEIGASNY